MAIPTNIRALRVKVDGKTTELKLFSNDDAAVLLPDLQRPYAEAQLQLRSLVPTITDEDSSEAIAAKIATMASEKAELIDAVNDVMATSIAPNSSLSDVASVVADPLSLPYRLPNGANFQDSKIEIMPVIDTSDIESMKYMFAGCSNLVAFSQAKLQTKHITDMSYMFRYCEKLKVIPLLDISSCENASQMLDRCKALEEVRFTGIWKINKFSLSGFKFLRTVEMGDTRNFTSMVNMFQNCYVLESIPPMDTSNVTDMSQMFYGCRSLIEIPPLDTSNVTDMAYMFLSCYVLKSIPPMDTSNVTDMQCMFDFTEVQRIELLDVKSLTSASGMLRVQYSFQNNVRRSALQYLKILNLGTTDTAIDFSYLSDWGINNSENRQSLIDTLLTYSCDRVAAGKSAMTLELHENVYRRLSSRERSAIIAKGYTLTY